MRTGTVGKKEGPLYCREQIEVPGNLQDILTHYTKAVLRDQPEDVIAFSAEYFKNMAAASKGACVCARQRQRKSVALPVRAALARDRGTASAGFCASETEAACPLPSLPVTFSQAPCHQSPARRLRPRRSRGSCSAGGRDARVERRRDRSACTRGQKLRASSDEASVVGACVLSASERMSPRGVRDAHRGEPGRLSKGFRSGRPASPPGM